MQFDNLDFSVVPVIWLDEPDHCYWPPGMKNIRTAIVKEMSVKDNFMKYKCQIFSKHGKNKIRLFKLDKVRKALLYMFMVLILFY